MKRHSKFFLVTILTIALLLTTACRDTGPTGSIDSNVESSQIYSTPSYTGFVSGLAPVISSSKAGSDTEQSGETDSSDPISSNIVSRSKSSAPSQATSSSSPVSVSAEYEFIAKPLAGDRSEELLKNPNRGFRLESYMNVESGQLTSWMYDSEGNYLPDGKMDAIGYLYERMYEYRKESPQVVQMYFYLTEYRNKDLDETAYMHMNNMFKFCRENKITLALRFAYVFNQGCDSKQGTTTVQLFRHINQLKNIIAQNRDVICFLETGLAGEWGEWSPSCPHLTNGFGDEILTAVANMIPDDMYSLVRYAINRDSATLSPKVKKKLGYHDDYITGYSHPWCTGREWHTNTYKTYVANSADVPVGGEMPWGAQGDDYYDGWGVLQYLYDCHYSVLSCYHNYREGGGIYSMKKWQNVEVTPILLRARGIRFYDSWFKDSSGKNIKRNLFDYIRDYLGYCVTASDMDVKTNGKSIKADFNLTNYGFAKPLMMKEIQVVLLDEKGSVAASKNICDVKELVPGKTLSFSVDINRPDRTKVYDIGIRFVNFAGTGARLANDLNMVSEVNVFGRLE